MDSALIDDEMLGRYNSCTDKMALQNWLVLDSRIED
jgi:hypothetical protein